MWPHITVTCPCSPRTLCHVKSICYHHHHHHHHHQLSTMTAVKACTPVIAFDQPLWCKELTMTVGCHGNKDGLNKKNWMTPSDWPTKNPSLVQKSRTYLKYELSCGTFCVQFSKIFHTVATWVSLKQIPFTRLNWPRLVQESGDISYTASLFRAWRRLACRMPSCTRKPS